MADRPTMIDLGVVEPRRTEPDRDVRSPVAPPLGRWAAGRAWHWWPAAVVATLLVLTAAGGASPTQPEPVPLFSVPAVQQVAFSEDTLYVADRSRRPHLTAYGLDDGGARWAVPLAGSEIELRERANVPLTTSSETGRTTAYHPDSGRPRWSHDGYPMGGGPDGLVVLRDTRRPDEVSAVDLATGETVWTVPDVQHPGGMTLRDERLITIDGDGLVTTYDAATGERLARMRAPESVGTHVAAGPVVITRSSGPAGRIVTAYDADTSARLWREEVPERAGRVFAGSERCRTVVCVEGEERLLGLDPRTGEVRWSVESPSQRDAWMLQEPGPPWPGGFLLMSTRGSEWEWILDARTGEPVVALEHWVLGRNAISQPAPVLTRRDVAAGRTWVGWLLAGAGGLRLAAFDSPARDCTAGPGYLACADRLGQAQVWLVSAELRWGRVPGAGTVGR